MRKERLPGLDQQMDVLKDQMQQVLVTQEEVDPKKDKWKVSREATDILILRMRPLKDLAMRLIDRSDYEVFSEVLSGIQHISVAYLDERLDYKSPNDDFLFFLTEAFRDILRVAERSQNVHFTRASFETIRNIAIATLAVRVLGSKGGHNHLTRALYGILSERAGAGATRFDLDRCFDAALNLGKVGRGLAIMGFGHTASDVGSDLAGIARLCAAGTTRTALIPIREALSDIFYQLLLHRKLYPNYDLPYKRMLQAYETVVNIPDDIATSIVFGEPLFGLNSDLFQSRHLSSLVYVALFPTSHSDDIVGYNLDVVKDILEFVKKHNAKDYSGGTFFTNHAYQIGLWLFAFIDKEISLQLTLAQDLNVPTEQNISKARRILLDDMTYLMDLYFQCIETNKVKMIPSDVLDPFLSLLYLAIHLDGAHTLDLEAGINEILVELEQKLASLEETLDSTDSDSLVTFSNYLARVQRQDTSERILGQVQSRTPESGYSSELRRVDRIKRSIVAFDTELFETFDKEIFGRKNESDVSQEQAGL